MARHVLHSLIVGALVLSIGALPFSYAQAAPAGQIVSVGFSPGFGPAVTRPLYKLVATFRLWLQGSHGNPSHGNPPNGNPPNGDQGDKPTSKPQDGVGIDPDGKRHSSGN